MPPTPTSGGPASGCSRSRRRGWPGWPSSSARGSRARSRRPSSTSPPTRSPRPLPGSTPAPAGTPPSSRPNCTASSKPGSGWTRSTPSCWAGRPRRRRWCCARACRAPGSCVRTARPRPAAGACTTASPCLASEWTSSTALVRLAGPMLARGYLEVPGIATPGGFDRGWFVTSDTGRLDGVDTLSVLGRADEVIVTGGSNVAAQGVESSLAEHPDVAAVAVAGRPDVEWGEIVVAVVVPVSGSAPVTAELRAHVGDRLGWPYAPREILYVTDLPTLEFRQARPWGAPPPRRRITAGLRWRPRRSGWRGPAPAPSRRPSPRSRWAPAWPRTSTPRPGGAPCSRSSCPSRCRSGSTTRTTTRTASEGRTTTGSARCASSGRRSPARNR